MDGDIIHLNAQREEVSVSLSTELLIVSLIGYRNQNNFLYNVKNIVKTYMPKLQNNGVNVSHLTGLSRLTWRDGV